MAANMLLQKISSHRTDLTPKARLIGDYILNNPRKVIFMTTKELSKASRVSEATVIRFVYQLGYKGYGDFLQELRDIIDTELTLIDRVGLTDMKAPDPNGSAGSSFPKSTTSSSCTRASTSTR